MSARERIVLRRPQGRRQRWLRLVVTAAILAITAVAVYFAFFAGGGKEGFQVETFVAKRGTIQRTLTFTGTVVAAREADLRFASTGEITEIPVTLGQRVSEGDILAVLDGETAQRNLERAKLNLESAQIRLNQLLEPGSSELASAQSALANAEAAVTKAQNQLAAAERALAQLLEGPSDAALAAAQAAVASANATLAQARNLVSSAETNEQQALAAYQAALDRYCGFRFHLREACSANEDGLDDSLETRIIDHLNGLGVVEEGFEAAAHALVTANNSLQSARGQLEHARQSQTSAEAALRSAELKLADLRQPPDPDAIAAAEGAVADARAALAAAQAARASAEARLNALYSQSDDPAVRLQAIQVALARLALAEAEEAVEGSVIKAPFDGIVARIRASVGDTVTAQQPIISLVSSTGHTLELDIAESDLGDVQEGALVLVRLDAIPDALYFAQITGIGLLPEISQGIATFPASARFLTPQQFLQLQAERGGVGLGQGGAASSEEGAGSGPLAGANWKKQIEKAQANPPLPGMNVTAIVIAAVKVDVLLIPNRFVQREGDEQFVEVLSDSGSLERRTVEVGESDGQWVEILSGLEEGETVRIKTFFQRSGRAERGVVLPGGIR